MEATSVSPFALLRQQSAAAVVGSRVGSNLAPSVASRPALSKASTAVTATVSSTVTAAVASTASTEVSTLQTANKALVEEKTALLSRLQADNRKLGLLFHDVTETKRRLIREIDDVQAEKARLKSLSVISHDDSLERLLKASMLSPNARKLLPIDKRALAEEVHAQLTQLVAQCRENQVNVLQVVRDKAEQVELGFRASTPEGTERMEAALGALKNIASTLPGNLLAAEAVAASLSEAMVCALVDKSSAILSRREASMAAGDYNAEDYQQDLFGGGGGSGVGTEAGGGGGEGTGGGRGGAGGGGNAAALSVELKKVRNENDLLKKKISEMKKQHTSQLVKASEASKVAAQREAKTAVSPRGSPQKVVLAASAASLDSVRVTVDMDNDFNDLPEPVRAQALKVMAAHVLQTLRGNPLSGGLQMALLVATAEEISTQISGLVGGALKAFATQGDMDIKSTKSVEATVAKVLASPILFQEISSHTTLTLTYLCSRFGFPSLVDLPKTSAMTPAVPTAPTTVRSSMSTAPPQPPLTPEMADETPEYYDQYHQQQASKRGSGTTAGGKAKPSGMQARVGATMVESGQEFSLRPPAKPSAVAKGVPSFMQPVTKRK